MPNLNTPPAAESPSLTIGLEEYAVPLLQPDRWLEEAAEGELAVDVFETTDCFVAQSTIAGVQPDDLTLSLHRDLLTIRGRREQILPDDATGKNYLAQECYWGPFSRSILLPEPIDVPRATATLKRGILTIVLPKATERTDIPIENDERRNPNNDD